MDHDDRFIDINMEQHVLAINPPGEVNEIEIMRLEGLIKDPSTIGVFAVVVQRPVEEIPERIKVHQQFIPARMDSNTLLALVQRAAADQHNIISDVAAGLEEDDG